MSVLENHMRVPIWNLLMEERDLGHSRAGRALVSTHCLVVGRDCEEDLGHI